MKPFEPMRILFRLVFLFLPLGAALAHAGAAAQQASADLRSAPAQAAARETGPSRERIQAAVRAYAGEPPVQAVVKAALEAAAADPRKARAMASRARMAGWVPTVKLAARRGLTRDLSESQTLETDRTALSTDDDLVVEVSLTFELGRLVFDHDEVALAREERELVRERAEIGRTVVGLYFERRRLQLERDLGQGSGIGQELRIAELEALLDGFTDGAFRRMIAVAKRSAPARP